MIFEINLPHVFAPGASEEENAQALCCLMEHLISQNQIYLKRHHDWPGLYRSPVVYGRTRVWDSIPALAERGYGDCKTLSAALIAEYRNAGIPARPVFRYVDNGKGVLSDLGVQAGRNDFHILVETPKGPEDPSKIKGMGRDENAHFSQGPMGGAPRRFAWPWQR
jgi:hypothetical protein